MSNVNEKTPNSDKGTELDWQRMLWFHVPVVLVGGCVLLPLLFYLLADTGAFGASSGRISAKGSERLLLGLLSIAPVVYGYGSTLRFSTGRFIAAVVVLAFMQLTIAMRSAMLGGAVVPVTLGGGVVGIGIGYVLGHAGLRLRSVFRGVPARRLTSVVVVVIVLAIGVLVVRDHYRQVQYQKVEEGRRAAEAAQRMAYWQALFDHLEASGSLLDVASKRDSRLDQAKLTWQLNNQVEFSISQAPCVRVKFEAGDDKLPFIDRFLASRASIEERLGQTLRFSEPRKERVYAGGGVSQREVARLRGYWSNGGLSNCLENDDDLQRQYAWIADQVDAFFEILQEPLHAISDMSP